MLLKLDSVKNKQLRRFLEHSIYIAIVTVLIPAFLYFELCVVLPAVEEQWTIMFFIHICCALFLLLNIVGNMIFGMFTNTELEGRYLGDYNSNTWTLCSICDCLQPPRAWHCNKCDSCILKRDHHCTFFACCIGYYNHRYFMMFTFYIFISMIYAFYFNVKFLIMSVSWNHGLILIKFLLPLANFVTGFSDENIYVFIVVINVIVGSFTGFLFFYHLNNLLAGRITPEISSYTKDFVHNRGWKLNLKEVFGARWYLTWISPFINSQLPGNGIEWPVENKIK